MAVNSLRVQGLGGDSHELLKMKTSEFASQKSLRKIVKLKVVTQGIHLSFFRSDSEIWFMSG